MIHTVTLNPAVDKMLYLDVLKKNITNRVRSARVTVGGKGTHVSIDLKNLGVNSNAFGICHGSTGEWIIGKLRDYGLNVRFRFKKDLLTRTNYLLIEGNGNCTIVAENGVALEEDDLESLFSEIDESIQPGDFLVISGDASNCKMPHVYNRLIRRVGGKRPKIFLDTSGDNLKQCIKESPFLIKPNLDELSYLCERPVSMEDEDIVDAICSLDRYHVDIVAVSLGGKGSIVKTPEGIYRVVPPDVSIINTIGCGDCYLSGLIYGIYKNMGIEQTLRLATAISSAAAESDSSVGFSVEHSKKLIPLVIIEKL